MAKGKPQVLGAYKSINEMLAAFSKKHAVWPLVLSAYVPCAEKNWGTSSGTHACRCAEAVSDTDSAGNRIDRRTGPHTVPFLRRANFEDGVAPTIASNPELPRWADLTRQMAELLVTFGGSPDGTWLIRELTVDRVGICVLFRNEVSHHLIHQLDSGACQLNGVQTPCRSIDEVLRVLQDRPESLKWPLRLDLDLFVRPWSMGNVVSAPYSADGNYYDGVIVDIFPSGNFRNIPVNLARVSYVGYASDNDDCVPINLLRPATGVENPDFYTPGGLAAAMQSGSFQPGEDADARKRRLALLHEEALAREVVVDLAAADVDEIELDYAGRGTFVVGVTGSVAARKVIHVGLQVVRVENTDTEAASPDLIRALLSQAPSSCEVAFKLNAPAFAEVVEKRTAPPKPPSPPPIAPAVTTTDDGDVVIAVNPTFIEPIESRIVFEVPADSKSHGLKWLEAPTRGCYVRSVKIGSAGEGIVSEGFFLQRIGGDDASAMSKSEVTQAIRAARKSNNGSVSLVFAEDSSGYAAALEAENAAKASDEASAAPAPVEPSTIDVLLMVGEGKLGMAFISGQGGNYVNKVNAGGVADKTGLVAVGQKLLKVNGEDVSTAPKESRNAAIKSAAATGQVLLTLTEDKEGFEAAKRAQAEAKASKRAQPPTKNTVDVIFTEQTKLGLSFYNREGHGNWVSKIQEGSPAEATGQIEVGFRLIGVNGADMTTATKTERNTAIKQAWSTGQLCLTLEKDLDGYKLALDAKAADRENKKNEDGVMQTSNEVEVVFTEHTKLGISFTVVEGRGSFVTKIRPGHAAEASGKIKIGQRLLRVNDTDVSQATGAARTAAIKEAWASGELRVVFSDDPDGFSLALKQKESDQIASAEKSATGEKTQSTTPKKSSSKTKSQKADSAKEPSVKEKAKDKGPKDKADAKVKTGSKNKSQKSTSKTASEAPPRAEAPTICTYKNAETGRTCSRGVAPSSVFCVGHMCPSCGKAKGSRDSLCSSCADQGSGGQGASGKGTKGTAPKTSGPNPYLSMDRREVMQLLRKAKIPYDRAAPIEALAELALQIPK